LAVLEGLWLMSRNGVFRTLYLFWLKVFAISFGMGAVTVVAMSRQPVSIWSALPSAAAPTAFFVEAGLLGVMLFGWKRVGPGLHFAATVLAALATPVSAVWIIAANGWVQAPPGLGHVADSLPVALDGWKAIVSPGFPTRLIHMVLAAYLTTALVVGAAAAWRLMKDREAPESRIALRMAIGMFAIVAPLQLVAGDFSGKQVQRLQPAKLAAMEAFWDTRPAQPFHVAAWPDREIAGNRWALSVPRLGSLISAGSVDAQVKGLKDFPPQDRPPVFLVFWAFRVMAGLGVAMIGLGAWGAWLTLRGGPERSSLFLSACVAMGPAGFVSVIAGWVVAGAGLQPLAILGPPATRLGLLAVYALIFGIGVLYILRLIAKGPSAPAEPASEDRASAPAPPAAPQGRRRGVSLAP
ncbi:MAG TPA: cytochrome ubiquinol oxidase subunit I, partial [Phenylobacterium sp.]|nr:cytochrome ubiquinol oxidase subunit I [Phenylobacterium sp.]